MEVGLQLLLSPLNTNIIVRTTRCTVGVVLPVYSMFKTIENKNSVDQQKWLLYWAVHHMVQHPRVPGQRRANSSLEGSPSIQDSQTDNED